MEREAGTAANLEEPSGRTANGGAGGGKGRRHGGHSRFGRDQNPGAPHGGGVGDAPAKGGDGGSTARLPPPLQAAATCRPAPPHLPARSHPERSLAARTGPTGWATRYRAPAGGLGAARFGLPLRLLLPRSAGGTPGSRTGDTPLHRAAGGGEVVSPSRGFQPLLFKGSKDSERGELKFVPPKEGGKK